MRCASHATTETCPHDERYRLNISGTGIREMLRHGLVPPKEVVRPESALAAMQGIQPKGLGDDGEGTLPVAKVIQSLFPFYTRFTRLGGAPRQQPLDAEALTVRDLELACHEARTHTGDVYDGVYREYTALLDHNRSLQPAWVDEARDALHRQQRRLLDDLDEKLKQAPEQASDEFMYQDQAEVQRELSAARTLLDDIPTAMDATRLANRAWNSLPYPRYRGADDA